MRVTFKLRRKIILKDFLKEFRQVFNTFYFIPVIMTAGISVLLIVLKKFNPWFIPVIFLGSFAGYVFMLWILFDFHVEKDLHEGDE